MWEQVLRETTMRIFLLIAFLTVFIAVGTVFIATKPESQPQLQSIDADTLSLAPPSDNTSVPVSIAQPASPIDLVSYDVPFTAQAPTANWDDPFYQSGCEEASLLMTLRWAQNKSITQQDALDTIASFSVEIENEFGTAVDLSLRDLATFASRFDELAVAYRTSVTVDEMIAKITAGNLLIVPVNGRKLDNPYFTSPGPLYHMLVVRGYDPATQEFITNDPGTRFGEGYRYTASILFSAMQDYATGNHVQIYPNAKVMIVIGKSKI